MVLVRSRLSRCPSLDGIVLVSKVRERELATAGWKYLDEDKTGL